MMFRTFKGSFLWLLAAAVVLFPGMPGAGGQTVEKVIDLDDGDYVPDNAFGLAMSDDGSTLHAAICGTFFTPNNRLVAIDTTLDAITLEGATGLYPEEIACRYDGGVLSSLFVTNNADHSISVLKPDLTHDSLIDLTSAGGQYPFGLLMGPQGRYLYASTVNMGEIFRIDTEPGPTYLQIVDTWYLGSWFNGRMAIHDNKLLVPGADFVLGAVLSVVDLSNPGSVDVVILDGDPLGWPGANDVKVEDGFAYVTVADYNNNSILYEVDLSLSPPAISRTIDMAALGTPFILEYGIDASPDGNTLVVTYLDNSFIKVVGRKAGCILSELDLHPYGQGQACEAAFSPDGEKVYVSDQANPSIYVVTGIPQHGLYLTGSDSATLGGTVDLVLKGGEGNQPGVILSSLNPGPTYLPSVTLDIGTPIRTLVSDQFDSSSKIESQITVPNWPTLHGRTVYIQGLTQDQDGEVRPSNLHELAVL